MKSCFFIWDLWYTSTTEFQGTTKPQAPAGVGSSVGIYMSSHAHKKAPFFQFQFSSLVSASLFYNPLPPSLPCSFFIYLFSSSSCNRQHFLCKVLLFQLKTSTLFPLIHLHFSITTSNLAASFGENAETAYCSKMLNYCAMVKPWNNLPASVYYLSYLYCYKVKTKKIDGYLGRNNRSSAFI